MTVAAALTEAGYVVQDAQLSVGPVVLGSRRDFKVRWFLTQLKTSVVVGSCDHLTAEAWRGFVVESWGLARSIKGGLPTGLQSGVGLVAVMSAATVDPAAAALAATPAPREWFQGISVAAVHDRATGATHQHDGQVVLGRAYIPFLRQQRDLVTAALR